MTLMSKLMAGAGVLALSSGVAAAAPAVVQNDLNLRAGPGTGYEVVAAMPAGSTVDVMGCQGSWCQVAFGGTTGFASRAFLGGPVASGPAYRGYGEGYAYEGGSAPRYGNTYGYDGGPAYGQSYGYSEGERTFGNERRLNDEGVTRGGRRFGEEGAARGARAGANASASDRRASEIQGANPMMNAKEAPAAGNRMRDGETAAEIQGANPMLNAKGAAAGSANTNARAEARGSANQRRGAANASEGANARALRDNSEDRGPNFIGPGKENVDNHH